MKSDTATTAAGIVAGVALFAKAFLGHELSPDEQKALEFVVGAAIMFIGYHTRKDGETEGK